MNAVALVFDMMYKLSFTGGKLFNAFMLTATISKYSYRFMGMWLNNWLLLPQD